MDDADPRREEEDDQDEDDEDSDDDYDFGGGDDDVDDVGPAVDGRAAPPPPRLGPWTATPNPVYGHRMKLFCRTGFHLAIGPKGRVTGTENPNDKYAVLEFSSVTNGEVRIRGVEANLFLAMNRQGKLYGQANIRQEGTVFVEMMLGRYNTYLSRKFAHIGWYVGIKKNGKQKPGQKTAWGQKAIQFLPIRVAR
ncbi:fibroblast growth factor 1-like [Thrips palmi]|uniref:Fibroblast growth factor n=1 Tax=Thrips palmi TaxID=161013 RepID=A0A6P9A4K5_THRPL|nr:fibroblast growth factor 1-like [Thrips palmi]